MHVLAFFFTVTAALAGLYAVDAHLLVGDPFFWYLIAGMAPVVVITCAVIIIPIQREIRRIESVDTSSFTLEQVREFVSRRPRWHLLPPEARP